MYKNLTGIEKFYSDIFGLGENREEIAKLIPPNPKLVMRRVWRKYTENYKAGGQRAYDILEDYYLKNKNCRQIGDKFGISRQRVFDNKRNSLKIMRAEHVKKELSGGSYYDMVLTAEKLENDITSLREKIAQLQKVKEFEEANLHKSINWLMSNDISVFGFSRRATNALKRAGYTTIDSLTGIGLTELYSIRNLGDQTIKEIVDKLKVTGIEVKKDLYNKRKFYS